MNPITAAVEPLRQAAANAAEAHARRIIEVMVERMEAGGWDLSKVAPRPRSTMSRPEYKRVQSLNSMYYDLTETNPEGAYRPHYDGRVRSAKNEARFIAQAIENSAVEFDAYVAKLTAKIGETTSAVLSGSDALWLRSLLTVTLPDGTVQKWQTKMILNVSCLGKVFNQFPTRLVK